MITIDGQVARDQRCARALETIAEMRLCIEPDKLPGLVAVSVPLPALATPGRPARLDLDYDERTSFCKANPVVTCKANADAIVSAVETVAENFRRWVNADS